MNNSMDIEDFKKMAFPKKKWGEPKKSPSMRAECPEADLQTYANEVLALKRYKYLRFPDAFLRWVRCNAPVHIAKIFFSMWSGRADNQFYIPLGNGYHLLVHMELKTADKQGRAVGRLHGKQKHAAKEDGWFIARSPEEIDSVIENAEKMAIRIKNHLQGEGNEREAV